MSTSAPYSTFTCALSVRRKFGLVFIKRSFVRPPSIIFHHLVYWFSRSRVCRVRNSRSKGHPKMMNYIELFNSVIESGPFKKPVRGWIIAAGTTPRSRRHRKFASLDSWNVVSESSISKQKKKSEKDTQEWEEKKLKKAIEKTKTSL